MGKKSRRRPQQGASGGSGVLEVVANYRRSGLGMWSVTVTPQGLAPVTGEAVDAHAALHQVLDLVEELADQAAVGIATVHQLDGDAQAWAELAAREGFVDCASGGSTHAVLTDADGTIIAES